MGRQSPSYPSVAKPGAAVKPHNWLRANRSPGSPAGAARRPGLERRSLTPLDTAAHDSPVSSSTPMATLQIIPLAGPPRDEPLAGARVRIGRSPENDIAIADPSVSRHHATIEQSPEGFLIRDLDSRNGVVVNGRRIDGPTRIGVKDDIQLGDVTLRLITGPEVTLTDVPFGAADTMVLAYDPDSKLSTTLRIRGDEQKSNRPGPDTVLNFLEQVTNAVLAARPFDEVIEEIVRQLFTLLPEADRACLLLLEGDPPEVRARAARHRSGKSARMEVSRTIVRRVIDSLDSVLSENAREDSRFSGTESLVVHGIFSVMCVPLVVEGMAIGALYVDTLFPFKHFDQDELGVFSTIGNIAAGHIQRQRLLEEAIQNRARERELEQAAAIQRRLLATAPVIRPGYFFHATHRSCLAVGGDYMDFIDCGDRGLVLAIGDVSGKGMGAALLMSTAQATVRAEVRAGGGPLSIARRVNASLYESTDEDKFITLFLGLLDTATGRLTYVNAGHDAPILIRGKSDTAETLAATGLIAGILPDAPIAEAAIDLEPGDLLYAYTDGLREARSPEGEEYGEDRLLAAIRTHRSKPAVQLLAEIEADVLRFSRGEEQQDDMTQLVVGREA